MRTTTAIAAAAYRNRVRITGGLLAVLFLMPITSGGQALAQQGVSSKPVHGATTHVVAASNVTKPKKAPAVCKNDLVLTLRKAGFKKGNIREAWAIAMRESHGHAKSISRTHDYGLYQFNRAAHSKQSWWNVKKLLNADYNAKVAYRMSQGGKTWYPWGLDGQGKVKAQVYRAAGWSNATIQSHIVAPFKKYLKQYDALPAVCK